MTISVFDMFTIGIGPSSSHTVGPMKAARPFALGLAHDALLAATATVTCELFGSLGATGHGHGSDKAVMLGLEGEQPETIDTDTIPGRVARIRQHRQLTLLGKHDIVFDEGRHLVMHRRTACGSSHTTSTETHYAPVPTTPSSAASSSTTRSPGAASGIMTLTVELEPPGGRRCVWPMLAAAGHRASNYVPSGQADFRGCLYSPSTTPRRYSWLRNR